MKKVCVDEGKCIGCGACVAISPENFDFNDEGISVVKDENILDKTIDAVEACPVFAISIEDSKFNSEDNENQELTNDLEALNDIDSIDDDEEMEEAA